MGECGPFDFKCQVAEAVDSLLVTLGNTLSTMAWQFLVSAFTGNAATIEDNEWAIATAMTSRWGLVLLIVVVALVVVQMGASLIAGNVRQAISAFVMGVLAWPATVIAVWLTVTVTGITDRLTLGIMGSGGEPSSQVLTKLFAGLEDLPLDELGESASKGFLIMVMVLVSFLASLVLSLVMAFRNFALICLVGFSPIAFMALPMVSIRGWVTKWALAVVALIMAKPLAAGMLVLAVDLTAASDGIFQWLVGIVAMGMAAFAPMITMRMFNFVGAETASAYGSQGQAVMNKTASGGARMGRAVVSVVR